MALLDFVKSKVLHLDGSGDQEIAQAATPYQEFGNEVAEGIKNWWYKNTGQAHLTSEYQHQEELSNTAKQREAADMAAAGLSKYGGVQGASSPTPQSGNGLLSTALQMSNLASGVLDLKERAWNYGVSKGLGIRTNDKNPLSQIASIFKILTGKNLSDYSDGDGVVGAIKDWWNDLKFNNKSETSNSGDNNPSNVLAAAATDGTQDLLNSLTHKDTYDRSRIPVSTTSGKSDLGVNNAFASIAKKGILDSEDGYRSLNDYGRSVIKGLSLITGRSKNDLTEAFFEWYGLGKRPLNKLSVPSSIPSRSGGGHAW